MEDKLTDAIAKRLAEKPPTTEKGQAVVKKFVDAEQSVSIKESSIYTNLVPSMDEAKIKAISQEIHQGFKTDDESRADWLEMHEFWLRLYMQTDAAQNSDPERDWGATESIPVMTECCDQFQSRTYKSFFPAKTFISAIPTKHVVDSQRRKLLADRADRIGRHMSWQLGVKDRRYKTKKRALFLGVALHGSFFTKTYMDVVKKRICVDNVRPTDLVINYNVGQKFIEEVRRKSHIIPISMGELSALEKNGFIVEGARPDLTGRQSSYNSAADESQGISPSNESVKSTRFTSLIEQQFYLDIDDTGDFKPYIGIIEEQSGKLLRLCLDYEARQDGTPIFDYEQIQYYTHYKFSENPDGFYGLGLGHKVGDLNSAINVGTRQMLDAATLSNDGNCSGFISDRLCPDGEEEVTLTLGKLKKRSDTTGDMKSGIVMMQFPGPNPALGSLLEKLDQRAQRLGSVTEATTGAIDTNRQPTTVLAQIEQAMEMFSSVQLGLADALGDEFQKIYRLNQKHMPLVEYYTINDTPEQITRADYADDMAIEPIFDPKLSTQQQKIARAQTVIQMTLQNPVNQQRPQIIDAAFRRAYEALDEDNIEELLPPKPEPINIGDQMKENMMVLMPASERKPFDVFPEHNHMQHLMEIEPFIAQYGATLLPDQQQAIVEHKQKHEAFLYGQQNGIIPAIPNGIGDMAGEQNNQMGLNPSAPSLPASSLPR